MLDLLVLTFKFKIYENICDDHHSSVLCSLDMQFTKHAVVLLHARERWGNAVRSLFSAAERVSHINFFNASP